MTRKQIKSAVSEAALRMKFRSDIHPSQQGEALFIEGAEWRINSVWHDNSVRPGDDCNVLVETKRGIDLDRYDTDYNELDSGTDWETEVLKWAYVSDLLPELPGRY